MILKSPNHLLSNKSIITEEWLLLLSLISNLNNFITQSQIRQTQIQMLPKTLQAALKTLGCPVDSTSELVSGVKLAAIVNKVFYSGTNQTFESKIIKQNQQRKGNNVININMILKQIKNDENIRCPAQIRAMTSFAMIEDEKEMVAFVEWVVKEWKKGVGLAAGPTDPGFSSKSTDKKEVSQFLRHNGEERQSHINQVSRQFELESSGRALQGQEYNQGDDAFENVYFCDRDIDPQHTDLADINDSLQGSADKVVKKGSFKVIRPKSHFDFKIERQEQPKPQKKEVGEQYTFEIEPKFTVSEEYKVMKNNTELKQEDEDSIEQKEPEARKTVPKLSQRPPIYKKSKQQTVKQEQKPLERTSNFFKTPTPFNTNSAAISSNGSSRKSSLQLEKASGRKHTAQYENPHTQRQINASLFKQVQELDAEIRDEKKSIKQVNQSAKRSQSSNRKMFKLEIKEISEADKKGIVQWLISINLLNSMAADYYDRLHEICKNGVIFPQIINHQKGRGAQLGYFKKPKRSAEVHSNYQKIFTFLKDVPTFESDLLFHYEYFVPEAQESAFWNLMRSCKHAFQKNVAIESSRTYTRQSAIKSRIQQKPPKVSNSVRKISSERKHSQAAEPEYQRIRYGSSQKQNKMAKVNQQAKKGTIKLSHSQQKNKDLEIKEQKVPTTANTLSRKKSSLEFIKDLPERNYRHEELKQVEQPEEDDSRLSKGYRGLHQMKKNYTQNSRITLNTPTKKIDTSMSRSRIISTNSMKKKQTTVPIPSVSLQMQMKGLKYLKEKNLYNPLAPGFETLSLFEDPIRNGTLFNMIIKQQHQLSYKFTQKPKNIEDCRQNYQTGFKHLKSSFSMIPVGYEHHYEDIIRGELNLFYGIIWHILYGANSKIMIAVSNPLKNQSAIMNISQQHSFEVNIEEETENIIFWIRALEQQSNQIAVLQIRDINSLHHSIVSDNLLFKIAKVMTPEKYTLRPTYDHPINAVEQQSNLKKILSYFSHNKIIRSDNAWKARSVVKKDSKAILSIIKQLMNYHTKMRESYNGSSRGQSNAVSFVKYARKGSVEKPIERLQTTANNHSFGPVDNQVLFPPKNQPKLQPQKQQKVLSIEIPWMRKLGYNGDLSLNSGAILCRLVSQMTMQTITYVEQPSTKAEALTNLRKAIKLIERFKWDEQDLANADEKLNQQVYKFLREKYRNSYAMKMAM